MERENPKSKSIAKVLFTNCDSLLHVTISYGESNNVLSYKTTKSHSGTLDSVWLSTNISATTS